ncbi:serine hydrolase [candidate division KSB1 bacterium]|nr:serine hydrolase [candidate division KSB1 bacterium]
MRYVIFFTGLFIMTCSRTPDMIFPTSEWRIAAPESQGFDQSKMNEALTMLAGYCGKDGLEEAMLIRNGRIIFAGDSTTKVHNIWSSTKSFTSTILGLLVEDSIVSLDDLAWRYEPLLREKYPDVTLRHFATMTSGYSAVGRNRWGQNSDDWSLQPFVPNDPLFEPGTAFAYWDEAMNMFGRVLTHILAEDIQRLLRDRITDPIGMGHFGWWAEDSLNGSPIRFGSTGIDISAQQLARFGHLFLNKGNWNGHQLISAEWIERATSAQVPVTIELADTDRKSIDGRGVYGYNWWVNGVKPDGQRLMPNTPKSTFYASGFNNNMCFVVPEWNMVLVRMGMDGNPPEGKAFVYDQFFKELKKSFIE